MTKKISAVFDGFEKFMCVLLGTLMILLVCDILLQVIARYCLFSPPSWTEELARRLMQLIVFCGAGIAYRKGEMTGITLVTDLLPGNVQRICKLFINVVIVGFGLFLTYTGYKMCVQIGNQLSPALRMPKWPFYAAIPFFGAMTVLFAVEKIVRIITDKEVAE